VIRETFMCYVFGVRVSTREGKSFVSVYDMKEAGRDEIAARSLVPTPNDAHSMS